MAEPDIESFVATLWQGGGADWSLARRAYAAYFIKANRADIEQYIESRIAASGASYGTFQWAKKTRRMLQQREQGPKGYHFDPRTGSLVGAYQDAPYKSFQIYGTKGQSLEHSRCYRLIRIAGMLFILSILGCLGFMGWKLCVVAGGMIKGWTLLIEQYTNL